ncbi:MAG TPA: BlaI/MecI/CopY family transcriptional regulator [Haliangium sp.]|nr:BlaI/MecI/CopY family transcriptional regulator [Haliangium sp.]
MPRKSKGPRPLPHLGELELAVLEHLWTAGEDDVAGAHAATGKPRGITPNTVGSALERLFRKKLVARRKVSHAYRYSPSLSREEMAARRVLDAAGGIAALSGTAWLSAFVTLVADTDEAALDRLEALIAEKLAQKRGARGGRGRR